MDTEEQTQLLLVEEEDGIEDSLIRKSKLLNTETDLNATNGTTHEHPNTNGATIQEPQNGNSTPTHSPNGANGHLPIHREEPQNNGAHQETENNSVYFDKDEGGNSISSFSGEESTDEGATTENLDIGSQNGIVDRSPNSVNEFPHEEHIKDVSFSASNLQPSGDTDNVNSLSQKTSTIEEIHEAHANDDSFSASILQPSGVTDSVYNLSQENSTVEKIHKEHTKYDSFSASILQASGVPDTLYTVRQETSTIKEIEEANIDLADESELDVEIPLEKLLQKQTTHDLHCPNCNSCITRVILRKRKRRTQNLSEDVKHPKLEDEIKTESSAGSSEPISNQGHVSSTDDNSSFIPPTETYDRDREPEIFRCLACFSFFIPTGDGFKLFGRKSMKSTSQRDHISEPNKNWFFSIFAPNKGRTPQDQGGLDKEINESNNNEERTPLVTDNENRLSSLPDRAGAIEPHESAPSGNMTTNVTYKSQEITVRGELGVDNGKESLLYQKYDEAVTSHSDVETLSNGERVVAGDLEIRLGDLETRVDGLDFIMFSDRGPESLGRSPADRKYDIKSNNSPDDEAMRNNFVINNTSDDEAMRNNFVINNTAYIAVDIPREYEQTTEAFHDAATIYIRDTNRDSISTNTNQIKIVKTDMNIQIEDNLNATSKTSSYEETIVSVGEGIPGTEVASQITEAIVLSQQVASQLGGQSSVVERRVSEAGETYGIEIIKSIVYGGLVESITSLSVISSAAGGGASTLHTLTLGLANLLGGLFIIFHNLYQLKNDEADDAINQVSQKNDKYQEILGKRKNFVLHAFVAIISYLVFGLLAPVIFGFSFRKSDDRQLKLAVVTAASFMCILVLAVAKAYVQTPPKTYLGTVLRYLILGFMVSGVSYMAGKLLESLFNDLGLFENSTSVPTLSLPVKPSNNPTWASF